MSTQTLPAHHLKTLVKVGAPRCTSVPYAANHDELQLQSQSAWGMPMNTVSWAATRARPSLALGPGRSAGELTTRSSLNSMNGKLKSATFHRRFLLICVGAGAQTRIHSIPAN